MGPGEFAVRAGADRFLAALHYGQTLSQRQGVETHVEIAVSSPHVKVTQWDTLSSSWKSVSLQNEPYEVVLHEDVSIGKPSADNVEFAFDGIPKNGKGTGQYVIYEGDVPRFSIVLESTGYAHYQ